MNEKEFLQYLATHLSPTFRKVTPEDLKRWADLGVLRPHPEFYPPDVHMVIGLMKMEQGLSKQTPEQAARQQKPKLLYPASATISQVLSFLTEATTEAEIREIALVRQALVRSGLISTLGFVYINFSPFSGTTLDSLLAMPEYKSRFEKAYLSKELLIIREVNQFVESQTEKEIMTALAPVLFIQGVKPTLVYSSFIFGGKGRFLGPGQYEVLPRSLYEEFLGTDMESLNDIIKFMADHVLIGNLGVPPGQSEVSFIKSAQEKMRHILMKAARESLEVTELSPLSPYHEDDVIEANKFGEMAGIDFFNVEGKPISVGEVKVVPAYKWKGQEWIPYDSSKLRIRRYYNWLDFMWAQLIDGVASGSCAAVCLACGKVLPRKRGRRKMYCGHENPRCYRARQTQYVRATRKRAKAD
jgi:hypothetical protein